MARRNLNLTIEEKRERARIAAKKSYEKNKEKKLKSVAENYKKNKEKKLKSAAENYEENKEKKLKSIAENYEKNKPEKRKAAKEYYRATKDEKKAKKQKSMLGLYEPEKQFSPMESHPKRLDIKEEIFEVKIKEEVCFELIEDQGCAVDIKEESLLESEIKDDLTQEHKFTFVGLEKEDVSLCQIKKEELNDVGLDEDRDSLQEEPEIDCEWNEAAVNEPDPLALPDVKYKIETPDTEVETLGSDSPPGSISRKDAEMLSSKTHVPSKSTFGARPFKCDECGYSSATFINLKVHMKNHAGEKLYVCRECKYSSVQLGNMKAHMKIHTVEKPHKCKECVYSSVRLRNLKAHMKIHTGERPHKCKECEYSCITSGMLRKHMRVHSGEKQFKCKECEYTYNAFVIDRCKLISDTYTQKRNRGKTCTVVKNIGEDRYKCKSCENSFTQSINLKMKIGNTLKNILEKDSKA